VLSTPAFKGSGSIEFKALWQATLYPCSIHTATVH
jgi:hypothetical protein